jgi:hypothetical protein
MHRLSYPAPTIGGRSEGGLHPIAAVLDWVRQNLARSIDENDLPSASRQLQSAQVEQRLRIIRLELQHLFIEDECVFVLS